MNISRDYANASVSKNLACKTSGLHENCTFFNQCLLLMHLKGSLKKLSVFILILKALHCESLKNGHNNIGIRCNYKSKEKLWFKWAPRANISFSLQDCKENWAIFKTLYLKITSKLQKTCKNKIFTLYLDFTYC